MNEIIMAPLLAFTDCSFREVYFRHFTGVDRALAPFIVVAENSRYKNSSLSTLLPNLHQMIDVEPQILGKDPYAFAALANLLQKAGFSSVNWNLGCPNKGVVSKGRGSGLLPYPKKIEEFLTVLKGEMDLPLTVKIRTGYYDHQEVFPLIETFNKFSLKELIIHPRLGKDLYEGVVNLDIFEKILPFFEAPVVYNGDIRRSNFPEIYDHFPSVHRWMIGRGLLADPFLPEDMKTFLYEGDSHPLIDPGLLSDKRREKVILFHMDLLEIMGGKYDKEAALVGKMKSYWSFLIHLFPEKVTLYDAMKREVCLKPYLRICREILGC